MDSSTNFFSPASRTHHSSFGILDDKAMEDVSFENLQRIRDKPPIPSKQLNQIQNQVRQKMPTQNDTELASVENAENPEQTVESIRLNDSDLKELEDDFSFEDDEHSDENDKENSNPAADTSKLPKPDDMSKDFTFNHKNYELTYVSPSNFNDLEKSANFSTDEKQSNEFLMDESSNILRNSIELEKRNVQNKSGNVNAINYDKMDEINQIMNNTNKASKTLEHNQNDSTLNFSNYTETSTDQSEQTPKSKPNFKQYTLNELKEKSSFNLTSIDETAEVDHLNLSQEAESQQNENNNKSSFNLTQNTMSKNDDLNFTLNSTNNLSSIERINQLVMQSVERVKRLGQSHSMPHSGDDYLSLINQNLGHMNPKSGRFSTSTVKIPAQNNPDLTLCKENNEINFTQANLTNFENTVLTTPSKTFEQSFENKEASINTGKLPSIYFKPESIENEMGKTFTGASPFDNPFGGFDNGVMEQFGEGDFSQFKQADDFMEDLKKAEVINRKEFADNELTVLNQTNSNNSSGSSSNEKWWNNMNAAQASKLEVSNLSTLSNSILNKSAESKSKIPKKKMSVEDYFTKRSEMPTYLADKESDVRLSEYGSKEKVLEKQAEVTSDVTLCAEEKENSKEEDITFSSNNQGSSLSSSNFSFTLNSSDTGDFIQKKTSKKQASTTPFQLSRALTSHMNKKQPEVAKEVDKKESPSIPTSLKVIHEELDGISNRVNNSIESSKKTTKQGISEPLMSSSIKISNTNPNLKLLMDETISSISSSDTLSNQTKTIAEADTTKQSKDSKSKESSSSQSKSKVNSGSLTSTPSKLKKSISESSNLNAISTSNIDKYDNSNNHIYYSQDSFISSIPERTNDSTLVGNHHQNHHHKHKTTTSHHTSKNHKKQNHRNAEIQTSPGPGTLTETTKRLLIKSNSQEENNNNRASISSVSSTSSTSSQDSTQTPPSLASQFNVINNLAAAMNASSASATNGLVPVAFIPLNSFLPCVQKFYDDMQTSTSNKSASNKSNFDSNLSTNSLNAPLNSKLFVETGGFSGNSSSLPSLCSQNGSMNMSKFELPQLELDRNSIDFCHIAEGCSQTLTILAKLTNPNSVLKHLNQNLSYFQIELQDSLNWNIDSYENDLDEKTKKLELENNKTSNRSNSLIKKKFNEFSLKSKFRRILTLHTDKSSIELQNNSKDNFNKIQFDLVSNCFEFFIHLNTKDLNFYKDFISQLDSTSLDQLEPLLIQTNLYIYYYFNNLSLDGSNASTQAKKYLLNRLDLKFVLGYARLRTNASIDSIEFEIPDDLNHTTINSNPKQTSDEVYNEDSDRTLTSINDSSLSKKPLSLEQLIPLSNAGNIDIDVDCYLSVEEQDQFQSIKFKTYEIKLDDSVLCLQAKSKQKQYARILISKILSDSNLPNFDLEKLKFAVEVKPNGFKYEIPIKIKLVSKPTAPKQQVLPVENKLSKNVKLSSSRSILFFGKSLNSSNKSSQETNCSGLSDEFTIMNSNSFRIKCQITLSTQSEPTNYFKFSAEMKTQNSNLNDSMNQLVLYLEPKESFRLKIKFHPPQNQFEPSSILTAIAKMNVIGFNQKFNVYLVGFLSESMLELENGLRINEISQTDNLTQQLIYRSIRQAKYSIELVQTQSAGASTNKNIFRKVLKLKNKSLNSKTIIYPCIFNNKFNKELPILTTRLSKPNELCFELGTDSNGFSNRLRILLSKEASLNSSSDLNWIEIRPDEQFNLQIEIIAAKMDSKTKSDLINIEDVYICLFWIEYDINSYCTQFVQSANSNTTAKPSTSFIDLFLNKLLSNHAFFSTQNGLSMSSLNINDSSAKLNRLSSVSSASLADQSCLSNNSMLQQNKSKLTRDDYLRLLRQSVKCSCINLAMQTFEFDNYSFEISDAKKENAVDQKKSDLLQISLSKDDSSKQSPVVKDEQNTDQSWSINPSTILFENIISERSIESFMAKIQVKNNLSRKQLPFDVKYNNKYLLVVPSNGILDPQSAMEISVKPKRDVFAQLPWFGSISIWCNKIQKDVRVSLHQNSVSGNSSLSSNMTLEVPRSLHLSQSINKSNLKSNFSNSSLKTLPSALTSASTPYNSSNNSNSLEQGTIISEISQYTLDSLSLTPLISASFIMPSSNSFSTSVNQPATKSSSFNQKPLNSSSSNNDSITKIVRDGNDAQVRFPPVCVTQRKSVELTLTNPTNGYVNWKAYSTVPAFVRPKENENNLMKSAYSAFLITPNSGTIPANQTQKIKIEFCPREIYGSFTQYWEIDTRTDFQDISANNSQSNSQTSIFTCRLVLTGKSIPLDTQKVSLEDDYNPRLANRILKSKTNNYNDDSVSSEGKSFKSTTDLPKNKSKENLNTSDKSLAYLNSQQSGSTSSLMGATLLSSTTSSVSSGASKNKVIIKEESITFPDTVLNGVSKANLIIHNREPCDCKLKIYTLMAPFHCKHPELKLASKHYIKFPIEFKPTALGEFSDEILIGVDKYATPLSCKLRGKCVRSESEKK